MAFEFRSSSDKWMKCLSSSGTIRAIALSAKEVCNEIITRHGSSDAGTVATSEAVIAGLLLASYCRQGEKVNLNIKASGWCHQAIIDANADAEVRGYVVERKQEDVHLAKDIGPWGIGLLSVLRTKFEDVAPYIGTVPLITGRLPKDLTFYWLQSEQVQSAVGIEVVVENGKVILADGFLIQALPGATDQNIRFIENHLKKVIQLEPESAQRNDPLRMLSYLLEEQTFSITEEKNLSYVCNCSVERVTRALTLVGVDELKSMLEENKDVEVGCDFCSENYIFSPQMLENLLKLNNS